MAICELPKQYRKFKMSVPLNRIPNIHGSLFDTLHGKKFVNKAQILHALTTHETIRNIHLYTYLYTLIYMKLQQTSVIIHPNHEFQSFSTSPY